jgi:hypothetical protein
MQVVVGDRDVDLERRKRGVVDMQKSSRSSSSYPPQIPCIFAGLFLLRRELESTTGRAAAQPFQFYPRKKQTQAYLILIYIYYPLASEGFDCGRSGGAMGFDAQWRQTFLGFRGDRLRWTCSQFAQREISEPETV